MSKVTIVSTLPMGLREEKPGQNPSLYFIQAAPSKETLGITHIGDAHYLEPIPLADSRAPLRRIDLNGSRVAESLVQDYIVACLGVQRDILPNGSQRVPGLFWVDDNLTGTEVMDRHADLVQQARNNTASWFKGLVELADDDWQKNRQHKMITDLQRTACTYLNLEREWNFDALSALINLCPSCKSSINPEAIICANCKYILKANKYKEMKDNFAIA